MPRITPYLFYRDVPAARQWLERVFGFEPKGEALEMEPGMFHAEMAYRDGFLMMGAPNEARGGKDPGELTAIHQGLNVYVDDEDAHYRRVEAAGVETLTTPEEMFWGDRVDSVRDLEGHHWSFAQPVRDLALQELAAGG